MLEKLKTTASLLAGLMFVAFVATAPAMAEQPANPAAQQVGPANAETAAKHTAKTESKDYTNQGLLDAAFDFCASVQNRSAKSCECEQKLLSDPKRFGTEEREMAFYYFTDKDRYLKEFTSRIKADPKWQEDFALRMSNMQALIIASCGA
ncbi:MAG: hypothetical protein RIC14_05145 [Filomicrobium sp.]